MDGEDIGRAGYGRRLARLAEIQGLRAALDAEEQRLLAALAADPAPFPSREEAIEKEWVREEIACLLHLAPVTAGRRLHVATELVHRLSDTLEALAAGPPDGDHPTAATPTNHLTPAEPQSRRTGGRSAACNCFVLAARPWLRGI